MTYQKQLRQRAFSRLSVTIAVCGNVVLALAVLSLLRANASELSSNLVRLLPDLSAMAGFTHVLLLGGVALLGLSLTVRHFAFTEHT